jgi:hypothetical protein
LHPIGWNTIFDIIEGKFVSIEKVNEKNDFFSNEALGYA